MMLLPLEIIPAGAGSGKTFALQARLGQWIAGGRIAPEKIVAVTFTEAAAAELRSRIRAEILNQGRAAEALRLDQAYITTIHGFGLRVMTEFAFDAGLAPKLRLLSDDEQTALVRLALAQTTHADPILADLDAYGYRYSFIKQQGPEGEFRDFLLRIVMLLRELGHADPAHTASSAEAFLARLYGAVKPAEVLNQALDRSVAELLTQYPESLAEAYGNNKKAASELVRDFVHLTELRTRGAAHAGWHVWQGLRELRQSNRATRLPEAYDALVAHVREAANALHFHPGPLLQAQHHARMLVASGFEVLRHYAAAKQAAGLMDYTDMIALAGQLLRDNPGVRATLRDRIDCLVVDEFQDTNPLQFDLIWQLHAAGVPTVIVGDLKQAIMGFQGADSRLFEALLRHYPDATEPLTQNWRAQPRLQEFVNALGLELFGADYTVLQPRGSASRLAPIEVIRFAQKAKKDQHRVRAGQLGLRLQQLLQEDQACVFDSRLGNERALRGGDIAVLCPTHELLATYAAVLRSLGLRVRLPADGWYQSRSIELARHALAYVANPRDRHAALYLAVTELGDLSLQQGLQQLIDGQGIQSNCLKILETKMSEADDRSVSVLVADTLAALDLFGHIGGWANPDTERANLLRLLGEADAFTKAAPETLAAGGFYGSGLPTFLAWLAAKVETDNQQPDPRVLDFEAIELTTWHSAKGREWPVVAVCALDREIQARLPQARLGYPSFAALDDLLTHARIEFTPRFVAPETQHKFTEPLQCEAETDAKRLLYVATTRAREMLILEWPQYVEAASATTYAGLLHSTCSFQISDDAVHLGAQIFSARVTEGSVD